jgi:hypothetical protein
MSPQIRGHRLEQANARYRAAGYPKLTAEATAVQDRPPLREHHEVSSYPKESVWIANAFDPSGIRASAAALAFSYVSPSAST